MKDESRPPIHPSSFILHPFVLFAVFVAPSLTAQTTAGSIHGIITASQRPLAFATVTATQNATGFSRTTVTRSDGSYRFASLPVGTYNITAEHKGFTTVTKRSVEVRLLQDRAVGIEL